MSDRNIVAPIANIEPIPGADFIVKATAANSTVVVHKNTQIGDLGVYFIGGDTQLSDEFCKANNLYRNATKNTDPGKTGYFEDNRRVRAQAFRKIKSEGFWCPLSYFEFTGYDTSKLKPGMSFEELNGIPICNKYISPRTRKANKNKNNKESIRELPTFPKHVDTQQLKYYVDTIRPGAKCYITLKMHGTSARHSHAYAPVKMSLGRKLLNTAFKWGAKLPGLHWLNDHIVTHEWKFLVGSRNVILDKNFGTQNKGFYASNDFRFKVAEPMRGRLYRGETIYGEIVGWLDEATPIMPPHDTTKVKGVKLPIKNAKMHYNYGNIPGECSFYVYRITYSTPDGFTYDLPWDAVKIRCQELGLKYAPEMCDSFIYDGDSQKLLGKVLEYTEGVDPIDSSHLREGLVLRAEHNGRTYFYKSKSWAFGVMEGYLSEDDSQIDIEEIS